MLHSRIPGMWIRTTPPLAGRSTIWRMTPPRFPTFLFCAQTPKVAGLVGDVRIELTATRVQSADAKPVHLSPVMPAADSNRLDRTFRTLCTLPGPTSFQAWCRVFVSFRCTRAVCTRPEGLPSKHATITTGLDVLKLRCETPVPRRSRVRFSLPRGLCVIQSTAPPCTCRGCEQSPPSKLPAPTTVSEIDQGTSTPRLISPFKRTAHCRP